MPTSSNKQQKKGKDGMGKEGKRKDGEGLVPYVPRLPRKSGSRCHQVPRVPRETKVDVSKWHACHANSRGVPAFHSGPSAPPEPAQCHTCHACHAKVEIDITKYHACHVKRRWMSPSATPATPTAVASRRSTPAQARHRSQPSAIRATPATQSEDPCHQVPSAIRATPATQKWNVTKYHACHVKRRWMSPSATPATPTAVASRRSTPAQARHRSQPSAIRATPATQKWKSMSPSTTPATPATPSFLPFVLPSFPPSLLPFFPPYFLASFLPSFLPSFCPVWSFIFFWCFSRPSVPVRSRWSCCRSHIYRRHAPQVWRELVGALEVLILQDCRFFDSPCLAFAAPPGCCPGCSYLSQGRSQGLSLSVQVEAFPFQLALEPRNAKSLTPDPGNFTSHRSQLTAWLMGLTKDSQWSRSVWLNATLIYATNENKHAKIIQTFHTTICFPHCIAGRLAPQRSARSIFHGAPKTVTQDVRLCTHVVLFFFLQR